MARVKFSMAFLEASRANFEVGVVVAVGVSVVVASTSAVDWSVGVGVLVDALVGFCLGNGVDVGGGLVAVGIGVLVGVCVGGNGVEVGGGVVAVGVCVGVLVAVGGAVGVSVGVAVGKGVAVFVNVGVGRGVSLGTALASLSAQGCSSSWALGKAFRWGRHWRCRRHRSVRWSALASVGEYLFLSASSLAEECSSLSVLVWGAACRWPVTSVLQ